MSLTVTADLLQTCRDALRRDGVSRLMFSLDDIGLVDWEAPLENGQPLLHCLVREKYLYAPLVTQALRRHPYLAMAPNQQGQTLWQTAWNHCIESSHDQGYDRAAIRTTLITLIGLVPDEVFGTTPEARQAFALRVGALQEADLTEALETRLGDVTLSGATLQAQLATMGKGQWPMVVRAVGGAEAPVAVTDEVTRPLWRVAMVRGLTTEAQRALSQASGTGAPTPEQAVWIQLAKNTVLNTPKIATIKEEAANFIEAGLPEGLATKDDLGRPAGWYLLRKSPHLLREMDSTQVNRSLLRQQDQAGHTIGFYVFQQLGAAEWMRQDLNYLEDGGLIWGLLEPVRNRGLLAQHYADPNAVAYRLASSPALPKKAAGVIKSSSETGHRFMMRVFTSEGMWAMLPGDAERIVATWLQEPAVLPDLCSFLTALEQQPTTRARLERSALGPYVPALKAYSSLYAGMANKTNLPQGLQVATQWHALLNPSWPALPVTDGALRAGLQQLRDSMPNKDSTTVANLATLGALEEAFFAKLRLDHTQRMDGPTAPRRTRLRS